jgi:hypothetical protein
MRHSPGFGIVAEGVKRNALLDLRRRDRRLPISSPESVRPERLFPLLYGRSKDPVAFPVVWASQSQLEERFCKSGVERHIFC